MSPYRDVSPGMNAKMPMSRSVAPVNIASVCTGVVCGLTRAQFAASHERLHERRRPRDDEHAGDRALQVLLREAAREPRAEQRAGCRCSGADAEQRPVDAAGKVADDPSRAD